MTIEITTYQTGEISYSDSLDAVDIWPGFGLAKHQMEMIQRIKGAQFLWSDVGESRMSFTDLLTWLNLHKDSVKPPRTGHIGGTWEAIIHGGGGSVTFNRGPLELGIGYPLLLDLNMTPSGNFQGGDHLYYPGTILENGKKIELPTYVYEKGQLVEVKSKNLLTPFVLTFIEGNPVAINLIHRQRLSKIEGITYLSDVLINNWVKVESYLKAIISRALEDDTPFGEEAKRVISKTIDRWAYPNGVVVDAHFAITNEGINHDGIRYSWDQIIALLKKSYEIAAHPETLSQAIQEIPHGTPVASKEFLIATLALLDTDFTSGTKCNGRLNPHFHWGGGQMAGTGSNRGYFQNSANDIKLITGLVGIGLQEKPLPIAYTLMPAPIFLLLPHADKPQEVQEVVNLLQQVAGEPNGKVSKSKTLEHIKMCVKTWLASGAIDKLSPAFLSRFSKLDHPMSRIPDDPTLEIPEVFMNLSIQQLLITVGILTEHIQSYEEV